MGKQKWATREDIAEIYDALANKALDTAANGGGSDDVGHVVEHLGRNAFFQERAAQVRATEKLGNKIGNRT